MRSRESTSTLGGGLWLPQASQRLAGLQGRGGFLFDSFLYGHDVRGDTTRPDTTSLALPCSSDLDSVVHSVHQLITCLYLADRYLFPLLMLETARDSHRVNRAL